MNTQKRKFGLLTAISMIVGIVVGSGIFFKTDNILAAVNGSVLLGVLAWILGGIGIVFGTLSIAVLAKRDENVGGLITYCEMTWGKNLGYLAGWFQTVFYYPILSAVLSWVSAMYLSMLLGWTSPQTLFGISLSFLPEWTFPFSVNEWVLSILLILSIYLLNSFKTLWAGRFQSAAMIIKLSALIILAFFGITKGSTTEVFHMSDVTMISSGFFVALVPIAFAYDGWQVAPSIAHEIKNPKRNLPLALSISPLIIMLIYVAYFIGINTVLGPEKILELGDGAVSLFAQIIFGDIGYRLVLLAVTISITGTLNGLILAYIRLPYALALRHELPMSETLSKVDEKTDIPYASAILTLIISVFWLIIHFSTTTGVIFLNWSVFSGISIDEISIMLMYVFLLAIFMGIINDFKNGKIKETSYGLIFPFFAIIGAIAALYGAFSNPKVALYLGLSIAVILLGLVIRPKRKV